MVDKKMLTNTVLVGAISLATLSLTGCTTEDVLEYVPKMTQEVLVYGPVIPYEDSNESDTNTEVDVTEIATTETNITETDIELTEDTNSNIVDSESEDSNVVSEEIIQNTQITKETNTISDDNETFTQEQSDIDYDEIGLPFNPSDNIVVAMYGVPEKDDLKRKEDFVVRDDKPVCVYGSPEFFEKDNRYNPQDDIVVDVYGSVEQMQ